MNDSSDWTDPTLPPSRSRYSSQVGIAFLAGGDAMDRAEAGDQDVAGEVVSSRLGAVENDPTELGERKAAGGIHGRGAAGWCAVAEWAFNAVGEEVIGAAALGAGAWLRDRLRQWRSEGSGHVFITRGAAVLIAAAYATESAPRGDRLMLEAAEDPVTMRGGQPSEPSYAGVEPWIVCLVNETRSTRHVVLVRADGEVAGSVVMDLNEREAIYYRPLSVDVPGARRAPGALKSGGIVSRAKAALRWRR